MELERIPQYVLNIVREREFSDEQIAKMTPVQLFAEYCNWNGLLGWGPDLWETARALRQAEKEQSEAA